MIKRLTAWHPRRGMASEDALGYWRGHHAALVQSVPGVRRYVQNHCTAGPTGDTAAEPAYTGLGELWFDDFSAAQAAMSTPGWRTVIEDAATFMDMQRITAFWAEEHVF